MSVSRGRTARRIRLDHWVGRFVVVGGIVIIASILAILIVIAAEVYPLLKKPSVSLLGIHAGAGRRQPRRQECRSAWTNTGEIAYEIARSGALEFAALKAGPNPPSIPVAGLEGAQVSAVGAIGKGRYALGTSDGRLIRLDVGFDVDWKDGVRSIAPRATWARLPRSTRTRGDRSCGSPPPRRTRER